jgi:hypothetical protein
MLQAEGLNSGASARAVRLRALSCCSSSFSPTKHGMAEAMNTLIGGPETLYRKTPAPPRHPHQNTGRQCDFNPLSILISRSTL